MREHPDLKRNSKLKLKLEVLTYYSNGTPKCVCCGESHIEFLTIDHINGDGNKQRMEIAGNRRFSGSVFYQWLKSNNYPEGYQILCSNCNMGKGRNKVKLCPVHHPELYNKV